MILSTGESGNSVFVIVLPENIADCYLARVSVLGTQIQPQEIPSVTIVLVFVWAGH